MREKSLIATLIEIAMCITILALIISFFDQASTIKRYEAILDVSCKRSLNVSECKSGIEALKKMSVEDIEKWGY